VAYFCSKEWKNRFYTLESKSKICQSTLCYWEILLLQYDPSVSVRMIWEAYEQNFSAFCVFQQELFHVPVSQGIHRSEKLSVRALWDRLLHHLGAEDTHSSNRWRRVCMEYNVFHKTRCRNLYNPLKIFRISQWTMNSSLGLFTELSSGISEHLKILHSNFSHTNV